MAYEPKWVQGAISRKLTARAAREAFSAAVWARDGGCCVMCHAAAEEAHHILDHKLFEDGGYIIDNGAAVCAPCHIRCETTEITCEEVRRAAGIDRIVLPSGFRDGRRYDKWGNEMLKGGLRLAGPLGSDDGCTRFLKRGGFLPLLVRRDDLPLPEWVGYSARTAEERTEWRAFIAALHTASVEGGPLGGWIFHGTTSVKSTAIQAEGMNPTEVMVRDEILGEEWVQGSYWGTALVAAWYAEDDLAERYEWRPGLTCSVIAARIDDLADEGRLVPDENSLDFPDMKFWGMIREEFNKKRERFGPVLDWMDSIKLTGAAALLHECVLPSEYFVSIDSVEDVAALIELEGNPAAHLTV